MTPLTVYLISENAQNPGGIYFEKTNYYSFIGHFSNLHQRRTEDICKNNSNINTYTYTHITLIQITKYTNT